MGAMPVGLGGVQLGCGLRSPRRVATKKSVSAAARPRKARCYDERTSKDQIPAARYPGRRGKPRDGRTTQ